MKILNILKKKYLKISEIKSYVFNDVVSYAFNYHIRNGFSGNFASTINIPEINVMYSINKDVKIDKNFKDFTKEIQKT